MEVVIRGSAEDSDPSGEMIRTKRIHSAAASVERDDAVEGVSGFVFVLTDLELKIFHVKDVADYDGKEGLCIADLSSPVRIADAVNSVDFLWEGNHGYPSEMSCFQLNSKIYLIGGRPPRGSSPSYGDYCYYDDEDFDCGCCACCGVSYRYSPPCSAPPSGEGLPYLRNSVFVLDGYGAAFGGCRILKECTQDNSPIPPLTSPKVSPIVELIDGKLYVLHFPDSIMPIPVRPFEVLDLSDPSKKYWECLPDPPFYTKGICDFTAPEDYLILGHRLIVMARDITYYFNFHTHEWTSIKDRVSGLKLGRYPNNGKCVYPSGMPPLGGGDLYVVLSFLAERKKISYITEQQEQQEQLFLRAYLVTETGRPLCYQDLTPQFPDLASFTGLEGSQFHDLGGQGSKILAAVSGYIKGMDVLLVSCFNLSFLPGERSSTLKTKRMEFLSLTSVRHYLCELNCSLMTPRTRSVIFL
ncbi:hypothetical protein Dimus_033777 [Dionaea muscipula]